MKGLVGFAVVFTMATLFACGGSDKAMTNENEVSQTTIHLKGKDVVVTLADAKQMQAALQAHLNSSKERLHENLPANLVEGLPKHVSEAWIDSDGNVRMDVWLLEVRNDEPVLTYRVTTSESQVGYQYVAHLAHSDRKWTVSSITYAKLLPRQRGR